MQASGKDVEPFMIVKDQRAARADEQPRAEYSRRRESGDLLRYLLKVKGHPVVIIRAPRVVDAAGQIVERKKTPAPGGYLRASGCGTMKPHDDLRPVREKSSSCSTLLAPLQANDDVIFGGDHQIPPSGSAELSFMSLSISGIVTSFTGSPCSFIKLFPETSTDGRKWHITTSEPRRWAFFTISRSGRQWRFCRRCCPEIRGFAQRGPPPPQRSDRRRSCPMYGCRRK